MTTSCPDTVQAKSDDLRRDVGDLVQQFADLTYALKPFQPDEPNPLAGHLPGLGPEHLGHIAEKLDKFFGVGF